MKLLSTLQYCIVLLILLFGYNAMGQANFDGTFSERKDVVINKTQASIEFTSLIPGKSYVFHFEGVGITENTNLIFPDKSVSFVECSARRIEFVPTNDKITGVFHELIWVNKKERLVHGTFFQKNNMKQKGPQPITIIDGFSPDYLVENILLGDFCMDINNVDAPGAAISYGVFFDGQTSVALETGLILSSGSIFNAEGPNEATGTSTNTGGPGDPDLALISGTNMNDCAILEFDFTPDQDSIRFDYVFASEEYCDYVGSPFNDAFGFFLSGPGISGPYTNNAVNLAILPDGTPVSINTVNWTTNGEYYVDNTPADSPQSGGCTAEEIANDPKSALDLEYDGFTVPLVAEHPTTPCSTYHIKLAVGDGTDAIFDSAVFIGKNSFVSGSTENIVTEVGYTEEGLFEAIEGCEGAYIYFRRVGSNIGDLTFDINVLPSSTAEEGVDFGDIPSSITIEHSYWGDTLWLDIFNDLIIEGIEVIELSIIGFCACTDPVFEVYINDAPEMFTDAGVQEFCEPTNVLLSVDVWGGVPGYTYEWENGATTTTAVQPFFESGSHAVTVTDDCGQEKVHEVFVEIYEPADTTIQVSICDGDGYEAGGGIQYWQGVYADYYQTVHNCDSIVYTDLSVLDNSDYDTIAYICLGECALIGGVNICNPGQSLIVLDGANENGCDSTIYYQVFLNFPIAVVFDPPVITCAADSVQMNTAGSTTGNGVTYLWEGPNGFTSEEQNPWVFDEGTYSFTIIQDFDGVLCESNAWEVEVETDLEPPLIDPGESQTFGCDGDTLKYLDASNSIFTDAIFEWTGPNGFVSNDTVLTLTELDTGAYTLTMIDTINACISDSTIYLSINQSTPEVDTEGGIVGCNSNPINIYANSSIPGVSYTWDGPNGFTDTVFNPLVTEPGVYYVTVSNGGQCFAIDTTEVLFDSTTPDLTAAGNTIDCVNPIVQITSNSNANGVVYNWSGPGGFTSTDQNPMVDTDGTYTIVVTGLNGCKDSLDVEVALNEIYAVLETEPDTLSCNNSMLNLSLTVDINNVTYDWEGPGGYTSGDASPQVDESGWYYVTVTSSTGCESLDSIEIGIDTLAPVADLGYNDIDCYNPLSNIILEGLSGNEQIAWTGPNGYTSSASEIDVDVSGDYTVIVTASNGCTDEETISISENISLPDVSAEGDTVSCTSGTATLTGLTQTPNTSFNWKNENGQDMGSGEIITVGSPGYYWCIVTDIINGCSDSVQVEVFQDVNVPDISTLGTTIDCNSSNFFIEAISQAAISYDWEGPNGFTSTDSNPEIFESGTYTITVESANGCIAVENVQVVDNSQSPLLNMDADTINCITMNTTIEMDATGNGNIYNWEGPNGYTSADEDPMVTTGGDYFVTVTSNNGCTSESAINIVEDAAIPTLGASSSNEITCDNPNTVLTATTNNPDVDFYWDGPNGYTSNEQNPTVTEAGVYDIVIIAPNGCQQNSSVEVFVDVTEAQIMVQDGYIDCTNPTLVIDTDVSNGSNETYNWEGPNGFTSNIQDPMITEGGDYFLTVTNSNGCESYASLNVDEDMNIPTSGIDIVEFDCDGNDASLSTTLNGSGYQIEWEHEDGAQFSGETISVTESGIYYLTITDSSNGCEFTSSASLQALDPVVGFDLLTTDPACLNEFGSISFTNVIGGGSNLMYSIDGGSTFQSSPNFNGLNSGSYDAVIVDGNNCQVFDQTVLAEIVEFDIDAETFHIIDFGDQVNLDVQTDLDPQDIDTIIWSPDIDLSCNNCLDPIYNGATNASFTVTVIDINGCEDEIQIEIRVVLKDLYIPNVFSPNGDAINNIFTIYGDPSQVDHVISLSVFDRWGNQMFLNENFGISDESEGWNGQFNGKYVNPGVYVYSTEILMVNGDKRTYGGDITVIR